MKYLRYCLALVASAPMAGVSVAHAQDRNAVLCNSHNPPDVIAGCSAIISARQETPQHLAMAYTYRGSAYADQDLPEKAIADYSQAIALSSSDPTAYFDRGVSLAVTGKYDLAIADFTRAIALKPDYAKAYLDRGRVRQANGDAAGAQADFAKARSLGG